MRLFSVLLCAFTLVALGACAGAPKKAPDPVFDRWQVMNNYENGEKLCYTGTSPTEMKGSAKSRTSQPYLMVTRRASGNYEISASSGFPYMKIARVLLVIDGEEHSLLINGTTAWPHDKEEDSKILHALAHADSVQLLGVSQDGGTSTDDYSVKGLSEALDYIQAHCK